ncbi:MAG: hypothetical protein KME15_22075 [Drouetiella hepatica Uher 2000/2452]|uniref:Uncharacterized protein n=1 Tax=Drouetiella hepatica Uher 2000/2452 TaxID=904376 RepID=A0A951UP05_9CYAN|nr:hypothetical protein [Drouetiella hepatica Uher 2000/2452]
MKLASVLLGISLAGLVTVWDAPLKVVNPALVQASAQEMTVQQKIDLITKSKGQVGSGDQLRRFFYGELDPIGIQPGGAGTVVNLYSKTNDVTFSYCSHFDVVVAVAKGKVAQFPANEVR